MRVHGERLAQLTLGQDLDRDALAGGQAGGANPMRDIPRFVSLLDSGQYNAKALVTRVVSLQDMLGAYEEVAYRTTVTAIMTA